MERLTTWNDKTESAELISWNKEEWKDFMGSLDVPICTELSLAVNKLAEYEDAEEQGLLLRLPCKVGDVLWCTDNKKTESFIVKEFKICAYKINRVEIYFENASGFGLCLFDGTLDEGWFLTKEEAEQALARMKGSV